MRTRWTGCGLLLMIFACSGCGNAVPPPPKLDLVQVSGTVKFGGKPTEGIIVTFVPDRKTKGNGATAVTDEEGKYELEHTRDQEPGIPAGPYIVRFVKPSAQSITKDGVKMHAQSPDAAGSNLIPFAWRGEPYENGEVESHNKVTVPESGGTLDFDIPAQ